jgi:hypothetical protein
VAGRSARLLLVRTGRLGPNHRDARSQAEAGTTVIREPGVDGVEITPAPFSPHVRREGLGGLEPAKRTRSGRRTRASRSTFVACVPPVSSTSAVGRGVLRADPGRARARTARVAWTAEDAAFAPRPSLHVDRVAHSGPPRRRRGPRRRHRPFGPARAGPAAARRVRRGRPAQLRAACHPGQLARGARCARGARDDRTRSHRHEVVYSDHGIALARRKTMSPAQTSMPATRCAPVKPRGVAARLLSPVGRGLDGTTHQQLLGADSLARRAVK